MICKIFEVELIVNESLKYLEIIIHSTVDIIEVLDDLVEEYPHIEIIDWTYKSVEYYPANAFKRKKYINLSETKLTKAKNKQIKHTQKAA